MLTKVGTAAMQANLTRRVHATLLLDGAGGYIAGYVFVPDNVSLIVLPPCAPELNPAERDCPYPREGFLALRFLGDLNHIIDRCYQA